MSVDELNRIINYIVAKSLELLKKYINEKIELEYVAIFSQNKDEYDNLLNLTTSLGRIVDKTPTGPIFKFNNPPQTIAGKPKLLKIRISDKTRPQRGDVDFNTNYEQFKEKYLDNGRFKLAKSWDGHEMVELRDENYDVLIYFSMMPLSKSLGVF